MSSFFPFLSCISSFHFFCGVTLRATKEKTGHCKTQTADCCFHRARSFHISHMTSPNSNQETIDSSEFLFSWGITAPKNLYFHEFSVPKASSFSIEHAWISRLLGDAAFSWCWPGKFLCGWKTLLIFWRICYLNIPCLITNITLIFMSSSSDEFTYNIFAIFVQGPWKPHKVG